MLFEQTVDELAQSALDTGFLKRSASAPRRPSNSRVLGDIPGSREAGTSRQTGSDIPSTWASMAFRPAGMVPESSVDDMNYRLPQRRAPARRQKRCVHGHPTGIRH
jgi:hypothetical protein